MVWRVNLLDKFDKIDTWPTRWSVSGRFIVHGSATNSDDRCERWIVWVGGVCSGKVGVDEAEVGDQSPQEYSHLPTALLYRLSTARLLPSSSRYFIRSRTICLPLSFRPTDMRRDVQEIFRATPHHKQVMMFSATLSKEIRSTCKKFMQSVSVTAILLRYPADL